MKTTEGIVILGAGISGVLAAHVFEDAMVLERNAATQAQNLTRMWGTNYLWAPIPGIDCNSFPVHTLVDGKPPHPEAIVRYKNKIGKPEDIGRWGLQFEEHTTGWDFKFLPPPQHVIYGAPVFELNIDARTVHFQIGNDNKAVLPYRYIISTIPLLQLCRIAKVFDRWPGLESCFAFQPIYVTMERVYQQKAGMHVNYISDPTVVHYRETVREGYRHMEQLEPPAHPTVRIWPGKIRANSAIPPVVQWLESCGVLCAGRWASWEPNELVHETYARLVQLRKRLP